MTEPANDIISATDLKRRLGRVLEDAMHGQVVKIERHGRSEDRLVLLREDQFRRLTGKDDVVIEDLRREFDELVRKMQEPSQGRGIDALFAADSKALGKAAVKHLRY